MPHVSEIRATPPDHDRHDLLLVAALAAGDASGTDRDHALALTRSCASCADLHDDLVAIARATAAVPPPIPARPRDFQLTPADAARLRPAGWRRVLGGLMGARSAATRPLGVGLATLGLVGLLVGNAPMFPFGESAAPLAATSAGGAASQESDRGGAQSAPSAAPEYLQAGPVASAAASAAAASDNEFGTQFQPSPSAVPGSTVTSAAGGPPGSAGSSAVPRAAVDQAGGPKAAPTLATTRDQTETLAVTADAGPLRPLNLVFGLAVLAGLALLVASRLRSRSRT